MVQENTIRYEPETGANNAIEDFTSDEFVDEVDMKVNMDAVFKRLSEDIYEYTSAGLREPLTNAVTAIMRAIDEGFIDESEGIIEIELYSDNENAERLIIRDNGIGITRAEVDKVISSIGDSTSRSDANLTGQFGMGFLATWMLCGGQDSGFIMNTNARGVDEEPLSGIWTSNKFREFDLENTKFSENQYGTELDIMLDNSITTEDIRNWVDNFATTTRVSVLFTEYKNDGSVVDEEYPPYDMIEKYETLVEKFNENSADSYNKVVDYRDEEYKIKEKNFDEQELFYTFETDYFLAVNTGIRKKSRTSYSRGRNLRKFILLDVPIDIRNLSAGSLKHFPLNGLEILFKVETPVVVSGPNEGKFVVSENESKKFGDDFISEKDIYENDIVTPQIVGNRDSLKFNEEFFNWLGNQFFKKYYKDLEHKFEQITTVEEYINASYKKRKAFNEFLDSFNPNTYNTKNKKTLEKIEKVMNKSFSDNFKETFRKLEEKKVSVAKKSSKGVSRAENRTSLSLIDVVDETYNTENNVYMAHRITQESAEFVWSADKEHKVVQVNSNNQSLYEEVFNWKKLNELDYETDLSMDDTVRKKFTEDSIGYETVKLHIGEYSNTINVQIKDLKELTIDNNDINDYEPDKIYLFQRGKHKITEHKDIVGDYIGTISVSKKIYDDLIDTTELFECGSKCSKDYEIPVPARSSKFTTDDSIRNDSYILHNVSEDYIHLFRDKEIAKNIEEYIEENIKENYVEDDVKYLPITNFEYNRMGNVYTHWDIWKVTDGDDLFADNNRHKTINKSEVEMYIIGKFKDNIDNISLLKAASKTKAKLDEGGIELINLIENNI